MSVEYNSILLAKLSSLTDEDELVDLLDEIKEIKDPIFLYPLYEAYKKNKESYVSHYFISTISELNSNNVIQIALEIGEDSKSNIVDIEYVLEIFNQRKIYEQRAINIALKAFQKFITKKSDSEYSLYSIISYLKNAGYLNFIENDLFKIFISNEFNLKSRQYAFGKWLKADPKKNLQLIIDNYNDIRQNSEQELIIAKVICGWKGPKVEELRDIIEINGGLQAKNIIKRFKEKDEEKKQKTIFEKNKILEKIYSNADLIEKISLLRKRINDVAKANKNIGFIIFPPNEAIFLQSKIANDDATLIKACVNLRDFIQNLNNELSNYGLSDDEVKKLLPDTAEQDLGKSINKLFLYLTSKKFSVDNSVFGLKQLNQILGLIGAHPDKDKIALFKKLEEVGLDKAYNNEEWDIIHQSLLEKYINSLNLLLNTIKLTEK